MQLICVNIELMLNYIGCWQVKRLAFHAARSMGLALDTVLGITTSLWGCFITGILM